MSEIARFISGVLKALVTPSRFLSLLIVPNLYHLLTLTVSG